MQNAILKMLIGAILPALTPVLKQMLENTATEFYKFARRTENDLDDMVADMLIDILGMPRPETDRPGHADPPLKTPDVNS